MSDLNRTPATRINELERELDKALGIVTALACRTGAEHYELWAEALRGRLLPGTIRKEPHRG